MKNFLFEGLIVTLLFMVSGTTVLTGCSPNINQPSLRLVRVAWPNTLAGHPSWKPILAWQYA